ncbi:peptidase inhibitor family I36 protein [Methylobacterium sp. J-077]|uniref:peptidase inhibitor family I36 protein n=1 Tax=Methylobacterium sp. J-077 TaxID=2836656 RepID=UPI001FB98F9D|nr:peptidase inhibitor family I36 protein [Methylobacterium sp. J-077]MCJ2122268.1 peptidase inhibitor family I36 protein [Methylobacterium sp. J-077]
MGAVVLADPGEETRTGSKRRFVVPALLVLGWAGLFAYSAAYLTEDMPFRQQTAETRAAPKPLGRRVVMLDMPDEAIPDVQRPDAALQAATQAAPSQASPGTSAAIAAPPAVPATAKPTGAANAEFVGVWGPTVDACAARSRRLGYLPATITQERARAGRTICNFHDGRRVGNAWVVSAECSDRGRHWSSQVRLMVAGDRLTWSSGRGTAAYVRCGRRGG